MYMGVLILIILDQGKAKLRRCLNKERKVQVTDVADIEIKGG